MENIALKNQLRIKTHCLLSNMMNFEISKKNIINKQLDEKWKE